MSLYNPTTITRTFDYGGLGVGPHVLQVRAVNGTATVDAFITAAFYPTATQRTVITYAYDPLYRLTQANATGALTYTFEYDYDAVGNRTAQTATITSTQVTNYVYDAANRLTSVNGQSYTWDDNGNLVSDGEKTYTYNQANRLTDLTQGETTFQFDYNGDGVRLRQMIAGVPTTYTQDLATPLPVVLQSKTGTNAMRYVYALGTRPLAQYGSAWEYLLADALGSVRQIVDDSGNVTLAESYEPYSSVLSSTGTASSIFGYSGEQLDTYIKLVFLRARYYSPDTARFLSKDVWQGDYTRPQSLNAWMYVEGDPINRIDPTGQWWCRPSCDPSCEDWVEAALDRLKNAGPNGENMWSNFIRLDDALPLEVGIFFVQQDPMNEQASTDRLGIYQMAFPLRWLHDDVNPSEEFDRHVAALGHEIWHLTHGPKLASVQREVDANVRQGFVLMELGYAMPEAREELYNAAWEPGGYVSETYEKLCPAKNILFDHWPAYKDISVLMFNPFSFNAVCIQYGLE